MNTLLISAGFVAAASLAHRIWRMPAKGLRAADIEALAWEQSCEPSSSGGGAGARVNLPILAGPSRRASPILAPAN